MSESGLRNWCFTTFNLQLQVPENDKNFRYCVFQTELCPTTGQLHYQGYVEFTRTMRMKKIKELFQDETMHLEPRQGSRVQARAYCMKPESQFAQPLEYGTWEVAPGKRLDLVESREIICGKRRREDLYKDPALDAVMTKYPRWAEKVFNLRDRGFSMEINLYPWQEEIIKLLQGEPEHRRIIWIWSNASNTGKSTFYTYCSTIFKVLPATGKYADVLYAYDDHDIIWLDFTRSQQGYESYQLLESMSNHGYLLSTKFQCETKFVKTHVVVTSNHAPDESKLPNRFVIYNIDPIEDVQTNGPTDE